MGRLRTVQGFEAGDDFVVSIFERIFGPAAGEVDPPTLDGTPGDWWRTFAIVPSVLRHAVGGFALYQSANRLLPASLRELGQTRAGWLCESRFVYHQHLKSCAEAGVPAEKIAAICAWEVSPHFDGAERAVLAYTDELVGAAGRVSDEVFAALRAHLSDEQILELTYITAMYAMHATISRALRLEWDDGADPVAEPPVRAVVARDTDAGG